MNGEKSSKLTSLAIGSAQNDSGMNAFESGFKAAFDIIDKNLTKELNKLEEYPHMGERIMTLKIYKAKIAAMLVDMEKSYE